MVILHELVNVHPAVLVALHNEVFLRDAENLPARPVYESLRSCLVRPDRKGRKEAQGTLPEAAKEIACNPSALGLQMATGGRNYEFLFCYP